MTHGPWTTRATPTHGRQLVVRPLQIRAATVNEEERSVEAVLSTDGVVTVFDFERFEVIDEVLVAGGAEYDRQMPLLESHMRFSTEAVLGSIRSIRREGNQYVGRLHFAKDDPAAERAWNLVRQGHLTDVSVGYRASEFVDIPAGQSQRVGGRTYTAGRRRLRVSTRYRFREGSMVPIGADQAAKIRSDAGLGPQTECAMRRELRLYLESLGLRSDASEADAWAFYNSLGGDQRVRAEGIHNGTIVPAPAAPAGGAPAAPPAPAAAPEGQRSAAPPAAPAPPQAPPVNPPEPQRSQTPPGPLDAEQVRAEAARAERQRIARAHELAGEDVPPELVTRAINEGWNEDRMSREYLAAIRGQRSAPVQPEGAATMHAQFGIIVSNPERDRNERSLAAGLMHRVGTTVVRREGGQVVGAEFNQRGYAGYGRFTEQDAERGDLYRSWSLVDVCREALRLAGRPVPHDRDEMIRAAVSTTSLSNVFTTSINARVVEGYSEAPDTTDWCSVEEVSNFQQQERVSVGKTGALDKLPRGDTAKHATVGDEMEPLKIARYAKQFVVDEQDIIDDNLSGFQEVPMEMGLAAARLRPDLVYAILLANASLTQDSTALFHADHANTATAAFSKANLQAGATAMMQQTQGGVRLNLRPAFLLVNPTLEWDAREILTSGQLIVAGNTDVVRGNRNVIADLNLALRVEGRLDGTGVTDPNSGTAYTGSSTTWFLVAANGRGIRVAYLAGTGRRPKVRRFVLDKGQWGIGWDINMDIGAKALDYRPLYRGNT